MKILALIEKTKNGNYDISTPEIDNKIFGEGDSVQQAKDDFLNNYHEIVGSFNDSAVKLPAELKNAQFEYKYDIPSLFNEFDFINVSHFARRIGINPGLMRQYKSNSTYISKKQKKKIEKALHEFATDILTIKL